MKKLLIIFFSLVLSGCSLISLFYPISQTECTSLTGWCEINSRLEVDHWSNAEIINLSELPNSSPKHYQMISDLNDKKRKQFESCGMLDWAFKKAFSDLTDSQKVCLKNAGYCRLYNATNSIYDCNKEEILRSAKKNKSSIK